MDVELLSPARLGAGQRRSAPGSEAAAAPFPAPRSPAHFPALTSGKGLSSAEESVTLDNGGFAALELSSRHLQVKNTFSKKKDGAR